VCVWALINDLSVSTVTPHLNFNNLALTVSDHNYVVPFIFLCVVSLDYYKIVLLSSLLLLFSSDVHKAGVVNLKYYTTIIFSFWCSFIYVPESRHTLNSAE
jgi:hypothetical protein